MALPEKLYVVYADYEEYEWPEEFWSQDADGHTYERSHTFSPEEGLSGWNTDGGYPGYGPPKVILKEVVRRYNAYSGLVAALREIASDWSERNMSGLARSDERYRLARNALIQFDTL